MQSHRVGNRAQWIMRCDPHLISLCRSGNLLDFKQTSAMAKIRLNHVASSLFEKWFELMPANQPLAPSKRDSNLLPHFPNPPVVLLSAPLPTNVRPHFMHD